MLVLARKVNESIMIGEDIEVIVIDIKGDQVKLGIKAPKRVTVHRKEVFDDILKQNVAAASNTFDPGKLRDFTDIWKEKK